VELTQGQQVRTADGGLFELRKPVAGGQFWSAHELAQMDWGTVVTRRTALLANSEIVAIKQTAPAVAEAA
jgi:hypothetical protein